MDDDRGTISKPTPDPTVLTTEALQREIFTLRRELELRQDMREREQASLEKIMETRLDGMDKAAEVLSDTINRTPTEIQREIGHLRGILDERLDSVTMRFGEQDRLTTTQFRERDTRTEREARDNKLAVDAAFAAQEKQAVAQNEGNQLAINKSEQATAETIKANQELSKSDISALRKSFEDGKVRQGEVDEDIKRRLGSIESSLVGISVAKTTVTEHNDESRAVSTLVMSVIGTFLVALSIGIAVVSLVKPG